MDANQDLGKSRFVRELQGKIDLKDAVKRRTRKAGPATYFRGTKEIDGIFLTDDVDCTAARFLPSHFSGVRDHRGVIIEVPYQSLIGTNIHRIVRPQARRLNTDIPGCLERYEIIWAKSVSDRRQWLIEVAAARAISDIEPEPPPAAPNPPTTTPSSRPRQRHLPPRLSGKRRKCS